MFLMILQVQLYFTVYAYLLNTNGSSILAYAAYMDFTHCLELLYKVILSFFHIFVMAIFDIVLNFIVSMQTHW